MHPILWAVGIALAAPGCASDPGRPMDGGGLPRRGLGESCAASEDCTSTLCVDVGSGHAVCTEPCEHDSDCPGAGWGCVQPDGFDATICGCTSVGREICDDHVDDDCNGRVDDCRECGGVQVPEDDHGNCGECGHACRADQECHAGVCRCTDATQMECGASCIDVAVSTQHCGSCTNVCSAEQICAGGTCGCLAGTVACGGSCVDTQGDDRHCGACGHACQDAQYCLNGTCTCPNGWTLCAGACVDTRASATSCGSCGHACRADQGCVAGACACGAGITDCGSVCMDTRADPAHCGACDNVCPAAQTCSASGCRCPLSSATFCASSASCVDTRIDAANCGACDHACDPATVCSGGSCVCATSGESFCADAGCVPLATDPMHCGSCTTPCAPNQICASSRCACPASLPTLCSTTGCVTTASDPTNCGACGTVCRNGETCSSYACRCLLTSQRWCAAQDTCIDVYSDPMNCGSCGNVCPVTATCASGTCRCNTVGLTVCGTSCVDLTTDAAHCGSCAGACTGSQVCSASRCTCTPAALGFQSRISTAPNLSVDAHLAWDGIRAMVVWTDGRDFNPYQLHRQFVAPDGILIGSDVPLTTVPSGGGAYGSDVIWNGTEYGVSWHEGSTIHVGRFAADGSSIGTPGVLSATVSGGTVIGYTAAVGYYTLDFVNADTPRFYTWGAAGNTPGLPITFDTTAAYAATTSVSTATAPTGEIGVAFVQSGGHLVVFNADGSLTSTPISLPSNVISIALAHDGTTWVASWIERTLTTSSTIVVGRGPALAARTTLTTTAGVPFRSTALTLRGGEAVVTWEFQPSVTTWRIDGMRALLPTGGAASPVTVLDVASMAYMTSLTVADYGHDQVATPGGLLMTWSDTRWGSTEAYAQAVTLPPCAM